jgi:hypothetical protein
MGNGNRRTGPVSGMLVVLPGGVVQLRRRSGEG